MQASLRNFLLLRSVLLLTLISVRQLLSHFNQPRFAKAVTSRLVNLLLGQTSISTEVKYSIPLKSASSVSLITIVVVDSISASLKCSFPSVSTFSKIQFLKTSSGNVVVFISMPSITSSSASTKTNSSSTTTSGSQSASSITSVTSVSDSSLSSETK